MPRPAAMHRARIDDRQGGVSLAFAVTLWVIASDRMSDLEIEPGRMPQNPVVKA
jgi:hypothetical protein